MIWRTWMLWMLAPKDYWYQFIQLVKKLLTRLYKGCILTTCQYVYTGTKMLWVSVQGRKTNSNKKEILSDSPTPRGYYIWGCFIKIIEEDIAINRKTGNPRFIVGNCMAQVTAMSSNNGSDAQFMLLYMRARRIVWRCFVPFYADVLCMLPRG